MSGEAESGRLRSLDGLRGVAAVAVVFHHLFLIDPGLALAIWPSGTTATQSVSWRAATFPLHLLVSAGLEAVFVFFILSGLVLTLPLLHAQGFRQWLAYYPRRLVRLCLPVLASVAFAIVLLLAVRRYPIPGHTADWLTSTNSLSFSLDDFVRSLNLFGTLQPLNNPLWSLGWEILFSILLPVAVLIAVVIQGRLAPSIVVTAGCLVLTAIGSLLGVGALIYLPIFLLGSVLAGALPILQRRITLANRGWFLAVFPFVVSIALIAVPWVASGISGRWYAVTVGFALVGCLCLVFLASGLPWLVGLLTRPAVQWLGRVSFSLYLVHVPIIVTIAYLVGPSNWIVFIPIGLAASVLAAWGFYLVAERPSHLLSRWIGNRVARATGRVG
jgi:peptidoglycan/LPS O-acetylase OafA/YrhL